MKVKLGNFLGIITILVSACSSNPELKINGELKTWHKISLDIIGPETSEQSYPNPFLDYRLETEFSNGDLTYTVPGFYAADGKAGESSASSGNMWRVIFCPEKEGVWTYKISFLEGKNIAVSSNPELGKPALGDGLSGEFTIKASDKKAKDFRAKGRLDYIGQRYLQHKATGEFFIKGGADSPENFLGYREFDGTYYGGNNRQRSGEDSPNAGLHAFEPHIKDWNPGDPQWQEGKGKGIIGALNYLAGKGMNSVYFLTMNILGDGEDVWPYTDRNERYRFDCSKLDQWEIVFSHMDSLGIMLHIVLQETENELLLDAGYLDTQRKIYLRELVARFSHHLAITWNLGEEHGPVNWSPYGQTVEDTKKMADYLRDIDPYDHLIVVHTHATKEERDEYIPGFLGHSSIDGLSIQDGNPENTFNTTLDWLKHSSDSGKNWVVSLDEIGPADVGAKPDEADPDHDLIRQKVLWANLFAGGAGVEWYFGYKFPHGDLNCEDWRSRNNLWDQTKYALDFFHNYLPFDQMINRNNLVKEGYCFAKEDDIYSIYSPSPSERKINLTETNNSFKVSWYNPRAGGNLLKGSLPEIRGGKITDLGNPPSEVEKDWVCLLEKI